MCLKRMTRHNMDHHNKLHKHLEFHQSIQALLAIHIESLVHEESDSN
jgi:hypothetical protein